MTGRLIGIVVAGALIGYGIVPFFEEPVRAQLVAQEGAAVADAALYLKDLRLDRTSGLRMLVARDLVADHLEQLVLAIADLADRT